MWSVYLLLTSTLLGGKNEVVIRRRRVDNTLATQKRTVHMILYRKQISMSLVMSAFQVCQSLLRGTNPQTLEKCPL